MNQKFKNRVVSYFSLFSILLNTFQPFYVAALSAAVTSPSSAYAEELESPSPSPTDPSPEPSTESLTPEPSPSPSDPAPSLTVSPSPTATPSPSPNSDPELTTDTTSDSTSDTTISMPDPDLEQTQEDSSAQTSSAVTTDKDDYSPYESVLITGENLNPETTYLLRVSSSDPPAVSSEFEVSTDSTGLFIYSYQLDGNYRPNYLVEIFLGDTLVTSTTFTDAPASADLDQCANGSSAVPDNPCSWQNGNLNSSQAHYVEGFSVPYRSVMRNLPTNGTVITLTLGYDIKHSDTHALDYLTHFDRMEPHTPFGHSTETVTPTAGVSGLSATTTTFPIPTPDTTNTPTAGQPETSFLSLPAGERVFTLYGGTITNIAYNTEGDLTDSQSETQIDVTFTVDSSTAVLSWGGHIASRLDWGEGNSAGGISGSPYHMRLIDWNLNNLGQQDRSLQAGAVIPPGNLVVVKDVVPDDSSLWDFSVTDGLEFNDTANDIPDGGQHAFTVEPGTYTLTEVTDPAYSTSVSCDNEDSGGSSVVVTVESGQTVICTFTNTLNQGTLTINKNIDTNNDGQVDIFGATDWKWDIANGEQDIATGDSRTLPTGNYTISEDPQAGYHLVGWTCDAITTSGNTNSIPVTIGVNQDVTCTFTNARDTGTIIINKQTLPDGDTTNFTFTGDISGFIADDMSIISLPRPTGTYTSTETVPSGWVLESIVCDDTNSTGDLDTDTATINLDANETVTCTFTNSKTPLLTVIKQIVPSDYPALFNLFIDSSEYATNIGHNGSTGAQEVSVGLHTVSETAGSGTSLDDFNTTYSANCSDGEITLDYGDDETCTITNTRKTGVIEFLKIVDGGDALPTDWEFDVSGVGTFQNGQFVFYTGVYSVAEISDVLGYSATSVGGVCTDLIGTSATLTVTEDGGLCSFTNTRDTGSILVNKLVDTNGDGTYEAGNATANQLGFSWTLDSGSPRDMGTSASGVTTTVGGETHSVDEIIPTGYHFTGWFVPGGRASCTNPTGTSLPINASVATDTETSITLCNARDTGTITVIKEVDPDDTSVWDFVLAGPGTTTDGIIDLGDGESNDFDGKAFPTGSYTLSETTSEFYSTSVSCTPGDESGSDSVQFNLDSGEDVVCTFTNTRNTSSITVLKNIDWDESGVIGDHPSDVLGDETWTWDIESGEQGITTGQSRVLPTGQYSISEDLTEDYHIVDWTCDNDTSGETNDIDIQLSEAPVTCTITNAPDTGSISGKKFNDLDGDHVYGNTTTDPNLPGWTIQLDDENSADAPNCPDGAVNGEFCELLTNASGNYSFDDLVPGTYIVSEVLQPGWVQTRPNESFGGQGAQADGTYLLDLDPGEDITNRYFGNQGVGTITVSKNVDTDNDGEVDIFGSENWLFELDTLDYTMGTTVPVTAGSYNLSEFQETGYHFVSLFCDEQAIDGSTTLLDVGPGDDVVCTFTNARDTGDIDGYKWEDINGNSRWNDNENGLENWIIFIDENNNGELDEGETSTTTDESGYYNFDNLPTGEYTICEVNQVGWNQTYPRGCHNIELTTEGSSANFGNQGLGTIIVTKYEDKNGNGIWDSPREGVLSDWTFTLNFDEYSGDTDENGQVEFADIPSGNYNLSELEQDFWVLTNITCDDLQIIDLNVRELIQSPENSYDLYLYPGQTIHCEVGNQGRGTIQIIKDVVPDDDSQWIVSADSNVYTIGDGESTGPIDVPIGTIGFKEEPAEGTDGDLYVSEYTCTITEQGNELQRKLTGEGREFVYRFLTPGEYIVCTFINTRVNPELTIAKSNNASGALGTGDQVLYTLEVTLEDSPLYDVFVQDLPPDGFNYVTGSWTASSSVRGDIKNSPTTEPTYASPGVWYLGDMVPGEVVTLTYLAEIQSDVDAGNYKDIAYAFGCNQNPEEDCDSSNTTYAQGVDSEYIDDRFVGTSVDVGEDNRDTGAASIEGEVLGASTSLPATGADSRWLLLALALFIAGLGSLIFGSRMKSGMIKSLIVFAFLTLGLSSPNSTYAADDSYLSVRIEQPASPTRIDNFNLAFSVLDIQGRTIEVNCYVKKPGGSFVQFDVTKSFTSGGGSGVCDVTSSIMEHDGTYDFYVTADAPGDPSEPEQSSTVIVELDTEGPGTPSSYSKDHPSECRWVIKFHTASDEGETVRVDVYSSSETSFPTDSGTIVGSVTIGSDADGEFIHDRASECNKDWYYVIRAFDASGNQSGVVGDSVVTTITSTTTDETTGAIAVGGSILGASGEGTGGEEEGGDVLGEDEAMEEVTDGEGLVSGAQDAVQEALSGPNRVWWYLLIVLIVSTIGYNIYKRYYLGKKK